jgi:hypothetical protein
MIALLVALVILVLILWVASMLLPMAGLPAPINTVIYVVIVVIAVLWFAQQLGGVNLGLR